MYKLVLPNKYFASNFYIFLYLKLKYKKIACLFAVIFKTTRPKRQADGWLAKTLLESNNNYEIACDMTFVLVLYQIKLIDFPSV